MSVESDAEYYRRREQDHRKLADEAISQSAQNLHLDMADRYRELAQEAQLKLTGQDRYDAPFDEAAPSLEN